MSKTAFRLFAAAFVWASTACSSRAVPSQGSASHGAQLFAGQCALCHTNEGAGAQGPNLRGVFERKAAAAGFSYSPALKASGWIWHEAHLDRYLENPAAALPGTAMPYSVPEHQDRADIIAYLRTLSPAPEAPAAARLEPSALASEAMSGDWRQDRPGLRHKIVIADLPPPYATRSASNPPRETERPAGAMPAAPEGFDVALFADGLEGPRLMRTAPNGDLFIAETNAGRVRILRPGADGKSVSKNTVYRSGLSDPFGIAFYPPGPNPKWVYIGEVNRVIRFAYAAGDLKAQEPAETVVPQLAPSRGGHITRDVAFSNDGTKMFVSVGSATNRCTRLHARRRKRPCLRNGHPQLRWPCRSP
jgi:cytochrome c2